MVNAYKADGTRYTIAVPVTRWMRFLSWCEDWRWAWLAELAWELQRRHYDRMAGI